MTALPASPKAFIKRIIERGLFAAQNDKRIMIGRILGERLTRIGADDMDFRRRFFQRDAELPMRRTRHVFYDCNAHKTSWRRQRIQSARNADRIQLHHEKNRFSRAATSSL
jgi:hypothetical protein